MSAPRNQPRELGGLTPDMPSRCSLWLASLAMRSMAGTASGSEKHYHGNKKRFHGDKKRFHGDKKRFHGNKKRFHGNKKRCSHMVKYQKRTLKTLLP